MHTPIRNQKYYIHLICQTAFAMVFIFCVLISLDHVAANQLIWAAGTGSLASSSYCVFCTPDSLVAQPKRIIGGYIIGMFSGESMRLLLLFAHLSAHFGANGIVFAAVASVGLALILMVLLRLEHPPAAGLAVVLVIDVQSYAPVLVILAAAIVLACIRSLMRNKLMPLV